MKKASRYIAVLLSLLMLVTMTSVFVDAAAGVHESGRLGSENYKSAPTANAQLLTTVPVMDGVLKSGEWGSPEFTMTKAYLTGGKGLVWVNVDPTTLVENTPKNVTADVYMGWDATHFYFAMQIKNVTSHYNNEMTNDLLWKGDCLQLQIADSTSSDRYEYGFAWSTGRKSQLSYRWFPTAGETGLTRQKDYTVKYDSAKKTTTYEIALPISKFSKKTGFMKENGKIPFSFALHVYDSSDPVAAKDSTISPGCFYEWAQGVVGGTTEKVITSAATISLVKGNPPTLPPSTTTTTKGGSISNKTTTTTTTTQKGVTTKKTTTTVATTITTVAGTVAVPVDKPTPTTDTKILSQAQALFAGQQLVVNEYDTVANKDMLISKDQLLDMYYMKGSTLTKIAYSEDAKTSVRTYATKALPATVKKVYVVSKAPETTVSSTDTSATDTTVSGTDNTTAPTGDVVATTAATTTTKANSNGSSFPIVLVIVIAVVVIGGGAAAFFFLKKKN